MSMKKSLNTSALVTADSPKGQRATETFRAQYNKAGLTDETAQILNEHSDFAAYLLVGIRRFSMNAPDYSAAKSILGKDFITPEEVVSARKGIVYTDEQIAVLAETIPSVEMLEWCKENGYAVMPTAPTEMSLLGVREFESAHFCTKSGGWYADQKFASADRTSFGWLSIRKTPVPDSTSKNWNEQKGLLSGFETVPNVAEVSWFITTYFNVRGIRLFERTYVRTSSLDSDGFRVGVGCFGAGGLLVSGDWDNDRNDALGVASSRKLNSKP